MSAALISEMGSRLSEVLRYRNKAIIDRLADEWGISLSDSREIFRETLRWMWLCAEARNDRRAGKRVPRLIIDEPLTFIDQGWHSFILFTKAYASFCDSHFGFFIHHNPTPVRRKKKIVADIESNAAALEALLAERRKQYEYIYDKLGADVLVNWYEVLSEKYQHSFPRRVSDPQPNPSE